MGTWAVVFLVLNGGKYTDTCFIKLIPGESWCKWYHKFSLACFERYYVDIKNSFPFDALTLAFESMNSRTNSNFVCVPLSGPVITDHAVQVGKEIRVGVRKPSAI